MDALSINEFRAAWAEAQGDSFADRMARQSLRALAFDIPEYAAELA